MESIGIVIKETNLSDTFYHIKILLSDKIHILSDKNSFNGNVYLCKN